MESKCLACQEVIALLDPHVVTLCVNNRKAVCHQHCFDSRSESVTTQTKFYFQHDNGTGQPPLFIKKT